VCALAAAAERGAERDGEKGGGYALHHLQRIIFRPPHMSLGRGSGLKLHLEPKAKAKINARVNARRDAGFASMRARWYL